MKTILAPLPLQESLYSSLLKKNGYFTDIQILPFSSWLESQSDMETDQYPLLNAFRNIQSHSTSFVLLQSMIKDPALAQQILSFSDLLKSYHIRPQALPETTMLQKELKALIQCVYPICTLQDVYQDSCKMNTPILNTELYESSIQSYAMNLYAEKLQKRGLTLVKEEVKTKSVHFFNAMNLRQEIEACAQWIVNHRIPLEQINIILCSSEESFVYLKPIFEHYHLEYRVVHRQKKSKIVEAFLALFNYFECPSIDLLLELFNTALFDQDNTTAITEYFRLFKSSFDLSHPCTHVVSNLNSASTLAQFQKDYLLKLEEKTELLRQKINTLFTFDSDLTSLEKTYEILRFSNLIEEKEEMQCLIQIQNLINNAGKKDLSAEEKSCILYSISKINKTYTENTHHCICVSDLNHVVSTRNICFVLGATSKNYPGNAALTGLFEEEYVSMIPGFPEKTKRLAFHNKKMEWIFKAGENLFLSYPVSTLEGKGQECAFEIKRFAKCEPQAWPLIENYAYSNSEHQLNTDLSTQLFFRRGRLSGSVSSFERYWRCPYSYFLHTGLKLRKINQINIDQAAIGTLQHACIETCINKYGTKYAQIHPDELKEIVYTEFNQLKQFFIEQNWKIENMMERCFNSLILQFEFLNDLENHTDLILHQCEVEFHHTLFEDSSVPIDLNGFIDRIDANMNLFRILDYKSSYKSLSNTKIESGLQLQLLTYLIVAMKELNKKPLGAYYYSLKNKDIPVSAAKLNLRNNELTELSAQDWKTQWMKEHRLTGKTTSADFANDHNGAHIVGWSEKGPSSSYINSVEEIENTMLNLYTLLKERLLQGNIECSPVESACTFCDFASICRFKGQPVKSNVDSSNKEGENNHA